MCSFEVKKANDCWIKLVWSVRSNWKNIWLCLFPRLETTVYMKECFCFVTLCDKDGKHKGVLLLHHNLWRTSWLQSEFWNMITSYNVPTVQKSCFCNALERETQTPELRTFGYHQHPSVTQYRPFVSHTMLQDLDVCDFLYLRLRQVYVKGWCTIRFTKSLPEDKGLWTSVSTGDQPWLK